MERVHAGDKLRVVVAYRDRLAWFGTELIEALLERNGGELAVLNQRDLSPEEELTTDLLAILTVFGARVNGLRDTVRKSRKIRLYPDGWQRAELRRWFGAARYAYNQTVELLTGENAPAAVKTKIRDLVLPTLPTLPT